MADLSCAVRRVSEVGELVGRQESPTAGVSDVSGEPGGLTGAQSRVWAILRGSDEPLSVQEVAARTQHHVTTVRAHLTELVKRGLVLRERDETRVTGRPPWRYRVDPDAPVQEGDLTVWAGMVQALAAAVADRPDPERIARQAGIDWGRQLARRHSGPEPGALLTATMAAFGFDPEPRSSSTWWLRRCPFAAATAEHGHIICAAHHGLVQGLLAESGDSARLVPHVRSDVCVVDAPALRP